MSGHDEERDQLREGVSCAVLLERMQPGWTVDKQESTAKCLKYRRGPGEVLIVNHNGRGWWSPMSDTAKGDVFALAQHLDADHPCRGSIFHADPQLGINPYLLSEYLTTITQ